ncbi:hypothetical protein DF19_07740 [Streptomyces olindensis]|nr:hypothetical protein DF19_07740 [Streptomyces olindensis]
MPEASIFWTRWTFLVGAHPVLPAHHDQRRCRYVAVKLGQNPVFHLHAGDIAYGDPAGQVKTSDTGFDSRGR